MIVNPLHRFVYLAIPRTGSVATQRALLAVGGSRRVGPGRHYMRIPQSCAGYEVLTTVRNPYARIASHWAKLTNERDIGTCDDFVRRLERRHRGVAERPMVAWLARNKPTTIMRLEDLRSGLEEFFKRKHLGRLTLHRENASGRDWRAAYNSDLAERVHHWSRLDFERFGYDIGSWR